LGASIAVFKGYTVLLVGRGRAIGDLEKPSLTEGTAALIRLAARRIRGSSA
jgi:hypothetical protein